MSARASFGRLATRCAVSLAMFVLCLLGIESRLPGSLAVLWPANALLLALLVRRPSLRTPSTWLAAAAGYVTADVLLGTAPLAAALLAAANLGGVLVGLVLLRRLSADERRLATAGSVVRIAGICAAASTASASVGAVAAVMYFGGTYWTGWLIWFASDLVNYMTLLPLALAAPAIREITRGRRGSASRALRVFIAAGVLVLLLLGAAWTMRASGSAVAFTLPALMLAALHGSVFVTAVLVNLSNFAMLGLSIGTGAGVNPAPLSITTQIALSLLAIAPLAVAAATSERRRILADLRIATTRDDLTGVLRRGEFLDRAEALLLTSRRASDSPALMMMDLDHFKKLNDTCGHSAGDRALTSFAAILHDVLHGDGTDCSGQARIIGRLGGEEFAVLLPDTTPRHARLLAEEIRRRQAAQTHADFGARGSTVSIGVACSEPGVTLTELLERADAAVYEAKGDRDNVIVTAPRSARRAA